MSLKVQLSSTDRNSHIPPNCSQLHSGTEFKNVVLENNKNSLPNSSCVNLLSSKDIKSAPNIVTKSNEVHQAESIIKSSKPPIDPRLNKNRKSKLEACEIVLKQVKWANSWYSKNASTGKTKNIQKLDEKSQVNSPIKFYYDGHTKQTQNNLADPRLKYSKIFSTNSNSSKSLLSVGNLVRLPVKSIPKFQEQSITSDSNVNMNRSKFQEQIEANNLSVNMNNANCLDQTKTNACVNINSSKCQDHAKINNFNINISNYQEQIATKIASVNVNSSNCQGQAKARVSINVNSSNFQGQKIKTNDVSVNNNSSKCHGQIETNNVSMNIKSSTKFQEQTKTNVICVNVNNSKLQGPIKTNNTSVNVNNSKCQAQVKSNDVSINRISSNFNKQVKSNDVSENVNNSKCQDQAKANNVCVIVNSSKCQEQVQTHNASVNENNPNCQKQVKASHVSENMKISNVPKQNIANVSKYVQCQDQTKANDLSVNIHSSKCQEQTGTNNLSVNMNNAKCQDHAKVNVHVNISKCQKQAATKIASVNVNNSKCHSQAKASVSVNVNSSNFQGQIETNNVSINMKSSTKVQKQIKTNDICVDVNSSKLQNQIKTNNTSVNVKNSKFQVQVKANNTSINMNSSNCKKRAKSSDVGGNVNSSKCQDQAKANNLCVNQNCSKCQEDSEANNDCNSKLQGKLNVKNVNFLNYQKQVKKGSKNPSLKKSSLNTRNVNEKDVKTLEKSSSISNSKHSSAQKLNSKCVCLKNREISLKNSSSNYIRRQNNVKKCKVCKKWPESSQKYSASKTKKTANIKNANSIEYNNLKRRFKSNHITFQGVNHAQKESFLNNKIKSDFYFDNFSNLSNDYYSDSEVFERCDQRNTFDDDYRRQRTELYFHHPGKLLMQKNFVEQRRRRNSSEIFRVKDRRFYPKSTNCDYYRNVPKYKHNKLFTKNFNLSKTYPPQWKTNAYNFNSFHNRSKKNCDTLIDCNLDLLYSNTHNPYVKYPSKFARRKGRNRKKTKLSHTINNNHRNFKDMSKCKFPKSKNKSSIFRKALAKKYLKSQKLHFKNGQKRYIKLLLKKIKKRTSIWRYRAYIKKFRINKKHMSPSKNLKRKLEAIKGTTDTSKNICNKNFCTEGNDLNIKNTQEKKSDICESGYLIKDCTLEKEKLLIDSKETVGAVITTSKSKDSYSIVKYFLRLSGNFNNNFLQMAAKNPFKHSKTVMKHALNTSRNTSELCKMKYNKVILSSKRMALICEQIKTALNSKDIKICYLNNKNNWKINGFSFGKSAVAILNESKFFLSAIVSTKLQKIFECFEKNSIPSNTIIIDEKSIFCKNEKLCKLDLCNTSFQKLQHDSSEFNYNSYSKRPYHTLENKNEVETALVPTLPKGNLKSKLPICSKRIDNELNSLSSSWEKMNPVSFGFIPFIQENANFVVNVLEEISSKSATSSDPKQDFKTGTGKSVLPPFSDSVVKNLKTTDEENPVQHMFKQPVSKSNVLPKYQNVESSSDLNKKCSYPFETSHNKGNLVSKWTVYDPDTLALISTKSIHTHYATTSCNTLPSNSGITLPPLNEKLHCQISVVEIVEDSSTKQDLCGNANLVVNKSVHQTQSSIESHEVPLLRYDIFKSECGYKVKNGQLTTWIDNDIFKDRNLFNLYYKHINSIQFHSVDLSGITKERADLSGELLEAYDFLSNALSYHESLLRGLVHKASEPHSHKSVLIYKDITDQLDYIAGYQLACKCLLI